MTEIIICLTEKNQCLEEFANLNQTELASYSKGNFETLEEFYLQREKLLVKIHAIDEKIERIQTSQPKLVATAHERSRIQDLLNEKDILVTEILSQDLEILSFIDREKSALIQKLRGTQQSRKALKAYKSPNV